MIDKSQKRNYRRMLVAIICALCLFSGATVTQSQDSEALPAGPIILVVGGFLLGALAYSIIQDLTAAEDTYQGDSLELNTAEILENQFATLTTVLNNDAALMEKTTTYYAQFASAQAALMFSLNQTYSTEAAMLQTMEDLLQATRLPTSYYSETLRVFFESNNGGKTGLTYGNGNQYLYAGQNNVQTLEATKAATHRVCYAVTGNVWLLEGDEMYRNSATVTMLNGSDAQLQQNGSSQYVTITKTGVYSITGTAFTMAAMAFDEAAVISPAIAKFSTLTGRMHYTLADETLYFSYPGTTGYTATLPASAINVVTAMQTATSSGTSLAAVSPDKTVNLGEQLSSVSTIYAAVLGIYAAASGSAEAYYDYMVEFGGDVPISPNAIFIAPEMLAGLQAYEIQAIYTAYLYYLADWFDSNSVLTPQNVTISQDSLQLLVTGSVTKDGVEILPTGSTWSLYITLSPYELIKGTKALPVNGFIMSWEGGDLPAYIPLAPNMTATISNITLEGVEYDNFTLTPKRLDLILLELQVPTPIVPAPPVTWLNLLAEFWWVFAITIGASIFIIGLFLRVPIIIEIGLLLIIIGAAGWFLSDFSAGDLFGGAIEGIQGWFEGFFDWANPF